MCPVPSQNILNSWKGLQLYTPINVFFFSLSLVVGQLSAADKHGWILSVNRSSPRLSAMVLDRGASILNSLWNVKSEHLVSCFVFRLYFICLFCVCEGCHAGVEVVLPFHSVCSRVWTQVVSLGGRGFHPWTLLLTLSIFSLICCLALSPRLISKSWAQVILMLQPSK